MREIDINEVKEMVDDIVVALQELERLNSMDYQDYTTSLDLAIQLQHEIESLN
jgi:hypothetical protein